MNRFDVSVYAIRRRRGRRRPFEVRWQAAGRARSKSFITRALADSYRAELVRAARKGLEFDPQTGEPVLWAEPFASQRGRSAGHGHARPDPRRVSVPVGNPAAHGPVPARLQPRPRRHGRPGDVRAST